MTHNSTVKASIVTVLFAVFGVIGWSFLFTNWYAEPAVPILYALLLVHTFFSVRCFSALIDPKDVRQRAVDVLLVGAYAVVGLSLRSEIILWYGWMLLFSLAAVKYALLVGRLHYPILLRRKLIADIGGLFLGVLWIALKMFDDVFPWSMSSDVIVTGIFAVATIYYFFIRPLYVPDKMSAL